MAGRLQDKVCVITGAGSGMGKAMADKLGANRAAWVVLQLKPTNWSSMPPPAAAVLRKSRLFMLMAYSPLSFLSSSFLSPSTSASFTSAPSAPAP